MSSDEAMSSSDDEYDEDMKFKFAEIEHERQCLEREKYKLWCLENRNPDLELVRSGETDPTVIEVYRRTFQNKIERLAGSVMQLEHRYDRIPKVFVMNGQESIDIFVRIDRGVTGRYIKEKARLHVESKFDLCFMSGRVLADEEEVKGSSHAVFTCVPKRCVVCGEIHTECPKCGSKEDVEHERKYGLILCAECMEYAYQAKHEMETEEMACLSEDCS